MQGHRFLEIERIDGVDGELVSYKLHPQYETNLDRSSLSGKGSFNINQPLTIKVEPENPTEEGKLVRIRLTGKADIWYDLNADPPGNSIDITASLANQQLLNESGFTAGGSYAGGWVVNKSSNNTFSKYIETKVGDSFDLDISAQGEAAFWINDDLHGDTGLVLEIHSEITYISENQPTTSEFLPFQKISFIDKVSRVREGDSTVVKLKREGATDVETTAVIQLSNPFSGLDEPGDLENTQNSYASLLTGLLSGVSTTLPGKIASQTLSILTGIVTAETIQRQEVFENSVADNRDFLLINKSNDVISQTNFPIEVTFKPNQTEVTLEIETYDDNSVECTHGTYLEIPNQDRSLFVIHDNDEPDASFWTKEFLKALVSKDNIATLGIGALAGLVTGGAAFSSAVLTTITNASSSVLMRMLACANASEEFERIAQLSEGTSTNSNNDLSASNLSDNSSLSLTSETT